MFTTRLQILNKIFFILIMGLILKKKNIMMQADKGKGQNLKSLLESKLLETACPLFILKNFGEKMEYLTPICPCDNY